MKYIDLHSPSAHYFHTHIRVSRVFVSSHGNSVLLIIPTIKKGEKRRGVLNITWKRMNIIYPKAFSRLKGNLKECLSIKVLGE